MNIWETQLGYDLVHALISKLSEKETTQKSKMYYSAQEAESEINTEIKNNNSSYCSRQFLITKEFTALAKV